MAAHPGKLCRHCVKMPTSNTANHDNHGWEAQWPHGPCLMVSALVPGSSGPGSSPGWGHCVVFLGKTLDPHSECLSLPRSINGTCDGLAPHGGLGGGGVGRNTPSSFKLQKPG